MTAWVLGRHAMVSLNYGAPGQAARIATQARQEAGARRRARPPSTPAPWPPPATPRRPPRGGRRPHFGRAAGRRRVGRHLVRVPAQKHAVHPSQAYTLLGHTRAAYRAQDDALTLSSSPSVMPRALIAMDTAACLRVDGPDDLRLDRWTQDIADACERLRYHAPEGLLWAAEEAMESHADPEPAAEAYWIKTAMRAADTRQPSHRPVRPLQEKPFTDSDSEAAWLARVSEVYSSIPVDRADQLLEDAEAWAA
ncbi:DUF6545 domain-containing protein [Streptomyces sp. NPDC002033]|uniref:DUF6545 domain-containing protein n=1 Tax=unclassified Streptomyces TaxID=2593676 RepID=UPI00331FC699